MNEERQGVESVADFMLVVLTPALIIGMLSSFAMFLYLLGYEGPHLGRSYIIVFLFVGASVLIARISMEESREYAALFAVPLAGVMFLATGFSLWGLLCIVIVWWVAHQITWNCTWIGDAHEDRGSGLLQELGVDRERMVDDDLDIEEPSEPVADAKGWVAWWRRQIDKSQNQRPPGITVIYFAMLALPCFGIGHWFLHRENESMAMWMVLIYLGCSLGLLMSTSFLGLRRYLDRRRVDMPPEVARAWLIGGTLLTIGFLWLCLILPRPGASLTGRSSPFSFGSFNFRRWDDLAFGNDGEPDDQASRQGETKSQQGDLRHQQGRSRGDGAGRTGDRKQGTPGNRSGGRSGQTTGQKSRGKSNEKPGKGGHSGSGETQGKKSRSQSASRQQSSQGQASRRDSGAKSSSGGSKGSRKTGKSQQGSQSGNKSSGKSGGESRKRSGGESGGKSGKGRSEPRDGSRGKRNETPGATEKSDQGRSDRGKSDTEQGGKASRGARGEGRQKNSGDESDQERERSRERERREQRRSGKSSRRPSATSGKQSAASRESASRRGDESSRRQRERPQQVSVFRLLTGLVGGILRLLFYLALAIGVGYLIWRFRRELASGLRQLWDDLQAFWARLFSGKEREDPVTAEDSATVVSSRPQMRFSEYADPFRTGVVDQWEPIEVVRYTFEAVEAWGAEQGCERHPDSTALEYVQLLGKQHDSLRRELVALGRLYGQAAYAPQSVTAAQAAQLSELWRRLGRIGLPEPVTAPPAPDRFR